MSVELLVIGTGGLARKWLSSSAKLIQNLMQWSRVSHVAQCRDGLGKRLPYGSVDYCDDDLPR